MSAIGVFDSGVGGLSVLRQITSRLPAESTIYLADQAFAPYGERSLEQVADRAMAAVDQLMAHGARQIVVACNTASAAALQEIRLRHPTVPIVGMEPAVKPAAATTRTGVIGVLATSATFRGALYANVVGTHANGVRVVERIGTGLAQAVEDGRFDTAMELLQPHVESLLRDGADTIVLGCTHYPFLTDAIQELAGSSVSVIDPSEAVARQVERTIPGLPPPAATHRYLTTEDPAHLTDQVERLLGAAIVAERVVLSDPARRG